MECKFYRLERKFHSMECKFYRLEYKFQRLEQKNFQDDGTHYPCKNKSEILHRIVFLAGNFVRLLEQL